MRDNTEHHHSGLGLLTPADVHHGLAGQGVAVRATVLATAYAAHPETIPGRPSVPAGTPRGSVDQPTQDSRALAGIIKYPTIPTC